MEGLVKGVAELALEFVDGDREEHPECQPPTEIEERSRSTWAEVVSVGKHGDRVQGQGGSHGCPSDNRASRKEEEAKEKSSFDQNSYHWGARKEWQGLANESEGSKDGNWEIVGHKKKHPSRPHKDLWLKNGHSSFYKYCSLRLHERRILRQSTRLLSFTLRVPASPFCYYGPFTLTLAHAWCFSSKANRIFLSSNTFCFAFY